MLQPTFAAVVRTPLGLIPLIGNLIINFETDEIIKEEK